MTKRSVIITTSILVGIIALMTILFGAVFRVRNINVVYGDDFKYKDHVTAIVKDSKLKKGSAIFSVDKQKVKNNIEFNYPYARVDSVSISSFVSVKIKLSNRAPLYYVAEESKYYILDEECKVLEITADENMAKKYILLNSVISIGQEVEVGEFVSNQYTPNCEKLYYALYSNAVLNIGDDSNEDGNPDEKYLDREDMCNIIASIGFSQIDELEGKVTKLIISTNLTDYGVRIEITCPEDNLDYKINSAFSALRELVLRDKQNATTLSKSGTICVRYAYDENNNKYLKCEYRV